MFIETNPSSSYQRLGPGFSVLDPVAANTTNSNVEMFRALAESIEKTLSEDVEEVYGPCREKTSLWGFRPGLTQIQLYSHRGFLEA